MPFKIVKNDILKMHGDAIVSTANPPKDLKSFIDDNYVESTISEEFLADSVAQGGYFSLLRRMMKDEEADEWDEILVESDIPKDEHSDLEEPDYLLSCVEEQAYAPGTEKEILPGFFEVETVPPPLPSVSSPPKSSTKKEKLSKLKSDSVENQSLDDYLSLIDLGFSGTLLKLIDKSGHTDSYIYKKANVDRKLFSKIRNQPAYRPSRTTAIAFAFALELNYDETREFIAKAGYALSNSSIFDLIVTYFLKNHNYNIFELNEALFAYDQPIIGG